MRACYCQGPRPGHTLCPCREQSASEETRRILALEAEVRRLKDAQRRSDLMTQLIN